MDDDATTPARPRWWYLPGPWARSFHRTGRCRCASGSGWGRWRAGSGRWPRGATCCWCSTRSRTRGTRSARRGCSGARRTASGARRRRASGDGLPALKRHVESFDKAIGELDSAVEKADKAGALFEILRAATPLARTTRHLHATLQEARQAVEDKDIIALRDTAQELERAIELVLSDADNAIKFIEARSAEEQALFARKASDSQHGLNLLGAMFFPMTAVGAVLGMNLPHGLEHAPPWVYWCVLASTFMLGLLVRASISR